MKHRRYNRRSKRKRLARYEIQNKKLLPSTLLYSYASSRSHLTPISMPLKCTMGQSNPSIRICWSSSLLFPPSPPTTRYAKSLTTNEGVGVGVNITSPTGKRYVLRDVSIRPNTHTHTYTHIYIYTQIHAHTRIAVLTDLGRHPLL